MRRLRGEIDSAPTSSREQPEVIGCILGQLGLLSPVPRLSFLSVMLSFQPALQAKEGDDP
jgi:hypothetical protein